MKRIAFSLGLAALGASVANGAVFSMASSEKAWSVAASLRGFYDDNYTLANSNERDSFGFVVSPQIGLSLDFQQTTLTADYIYSAYYFDDRSNDKFDQTHEFALNLTHAFSERYAVQIRDAFVVAQEPSLIEPLFPSANRANGDNIRNSGSIRFNAELTRQFGVVLGYDNIYVDYEQDGGIAGTPSRSGLLDRIHHLANIDLRWIATRNTTALIGYQFGLVDYTGDEPLANNPLPPFNVYMSDDRNSVSHYFYAGIVQVFNPSLNGALKAGAQYTDYYNDPADPDAKISPYVEGDLTYTYGVGRSVQLGVLHSRTPTDVFAANPGDGTITKDLETTLVFVNVKHQITPKLDGSIYGHFQHGVFFDGAADDESEIFYGVTLTLTYNFNKHFSTDVSYSYDVLESDLSTRDYTRNRIFLGFTAAY